MADTRGLVDLAISEHIGFDDTGDNISAKRVASYGWDGSNWQRNVLQPLPLIDKSIDDIVLSNADANGNYQTIALKSSGSTVRTLSLTFDGSNNVTRITRT